MKRYERLLLDRIFAARSTTKQSEIQNIEDDCQQFLDNNLTKDNCWGGSESLQAISELFNTNVVVFSEFGGVHFGNSFRPVYEEVITIAYRNWNSEYQENVSNVERNHYDSIVSMSDDVLDKCTRALIAQYSSKCSIMQNPVVIDLE